MRMALFFALLTCVYVFAASTVKSENHRIISYWGQNSASRPTSEYNLTKVCDKFEYDVINLAFVHKFFDKNNKDRMPGLNFAMHCGQSVSPNYPSLLRCTSIAEGIKHCQKLGKKVLISLGGAIGDYGFDSQEEAKLFAYRIYHLFLHGNKLKELRPFGDSILDGINLDIEKMDKTSNRYYADFVRELRLLGNQSKHKYTVSASPQCPFPDRYMGPNLGKLMGDPELVDEVYVQFYNNWCHASNGRAFKQRIREWIAFSHNFNGPIIYVGLPAGKLAASNERHYQDVDKLNAIYKELKEISRFGGFMLWDTSYDQNNKEGGKYYSDHIFEMIHGQINVTKATDVSTTLSSPAFTIDTTTSTKKPKTTGKNSDTFVSCNGRSFGLFAHPTSCKKFVHCSHGNPHVKLCPGNLHFNPVIQVCDWPRNVECRIQ